MWYYVADKKSNGPLGADALRRLLQTGAINDGTLVWRRGFKNWTKAGETELVREVPATGRRLRLEFTGAAGEYFRIWIVNTFLTLITLGIYAAWAKVRTRQYFYANTTLDGHPFDYTANPVAILKGHLVIGAGVALYSISGAVNPVLTLIVIAIFGIVFPFLVYKSLRFFAQNTVYRNIRLRFMGTVGESYRVYLLFLLLLPLTLGLIFPYIAFRKKNYFFGNLAYGSTENRCRGKAGEFYMLYLLTALAALGVVAVMSFLSAIIIFPLVLSGPGVFKPDIAVLMPVFAIMYLMMAAGTVFLQQFFYAWQTNYCFGNSSLGDLRFKSALKPAKLFRLHLSNIFAIILSVGLLIPWAKVRRMKYITDNISVFAPEDLDGFVSAASEGESAYGDVATDFFDLEVGL